MMMSRRAGCHPSGQRREVVAVGIEEVAVAEVAVAEEAVAEEAVAEVVVGEVAAAVEWVDAGDAPVVSS
jgi:hypothetical protein